MKKYILSVPLVLFLFTIFSSCRRDYNCHCVKNGIDTVTEQVKAHNIHKAKSYCEKYGNLGCDELTVQ